MDEGLSRRDFLRGSAFAVSSIIPLASPSPERGPKQNAESHLFPSPSPWRLQSDNGRQVLYDESGEPIDDITDCVSEAVESSRADEKSGLIPPPKIVWMRPLAGSLVSQDEPAMQRFESDLIEPFALSEADLLKIKTKINVDPSLDLAVKILKGATQPNRPLGIQTDPDSPALEISFVDVPFLNAASVDDLARVGVPEDLSRRYTNGRAVHPIYRAGALQIPDNVNQRYFEDLEWQALKTLEWRSEDLVAILQDHSITAAQRADITNKLLSTQVSQIMIESESAQANNDPPVRAVSRAYSENEDFIPLDYWNWLMIADREAVSGHYIPADFDDADPTARVIVAAGKSQSLPMVEVLSCTKVPNAETYLYSYQVVPILAHNSLYPNITHALSNAVDFQLRDPGATTRDSGYFIKADPIHLLEHELAHHNAEVISSRDPSRTFDKENNADSMALGWRLLANAGMSFGTVNEYANFVMTTPEVNLIGKKTNDVNPSV